MSANPDETGVGPTQRSAADVRDFGQAVLSNVQQVIVGKRTEIERALVAVLSDGHILIEDAPGTGKTMLARSLAISMGLEFKRLQCTPDLLPSDVTGVAVFNQKLRQFEFRPGPVFTHILLADEINRATPRTQSALLEAMGELQVTVDGETRPLPRPFLVLATQNPIEFQGTFPLPEAQLDRFMLRMSLGYPDYEEEDRMMRSQQITHPIDELQQTVDGARLPGLQRAVRELHVSQSVREYILDVVHATRSHPALELGASPRATMALFRAGQARAALTGREYVLPDDVKAVAAACLAHRMVVRPEHSLSGLTARQVIDEMLREIEVPLMEGEQSSG